MTTAPNRRAGGQVRPDALLPVDRARPPVAKAGVLLAVGIMVLALNLRTSIVAVSPMLDTIRHDTGMSTAAAGLLTTLPLLCFGLLAPLVPRLGRRFGTEPVLLATMVTICAGTALRLVPSAPALLGGTVVIGAGIAVANVLLPGLIKREFGSRVGLMTGLYSMSLSLGAALAAGITVPLGRLAHTDWRTTLAMWGLLAVVGLIVWAPQVRRRTRRAATGVGAAVRPVRGLWRHPVAWLVTAFMGLQSLGFYALTAYLPTVLTDAGMSQDSAGWMLSLANLLGIVGAFCAPVLAARGVRPAVLATVTTVFTACGLTGLTLAPVSGVYAWIVVLGLGQGATFSLAMLFIVLRAPDGRHAAQLSGMAQCCGYLLAAAGPLALGAVHQMSGGWTVPLVALLALLVPQTVAGLGAARNRHAAPEQPAL
ncbi:MFS transporter, CP family, cyanate transporter [Streptomyces sp. DvalAA-14]|uniref:CynX/NimT family MFS transporter n=1 Tax=unclassified Streptomyces TaxID=2593676 RepID=UPI00081B818A|nr:MULTISPECIES: MFS transporter [unclassified Streptomyces]MYS22151.1 MFS transporter [Streptomyces sp. SID4948]SCE09761.1 MFS transporter, CP family, cyanate transporter [Streptomyces sp. DvalAA-14]